MTTSPGPSGGRSRRPMRRCRRRAWSRLRSRRLKRRPRASSRRCRPWPGRQLRRAREWPCPPRRVGRPRRCRCRPPRRSGPPLRICRRSMSPRRSRLLRCGLRQGLLCWALPLQPRLLRCGLLRWAPPRRLLRARFPPRLLCWGLQGRERRPELPRAPRCWVPLLRAWALRPRLLLAPRRRAPRRRTGLRELPPPSGPPGRDCQPWVPRSRAGRPRRRLPRTFPVSVRPR
ncbi:hypothetical protein EJ065_4625 [Corallococcus coralloides]|uniref:Uncharacterized protein n=1 Tax=Corallococcus coralloides TaxID=184914 RepID=A0A410RWB4_CORCK|nr:hypothetical protein EJ065_4625 [Corallococcus coralloides]